MRKSASWLLSIPVAIMRRIAIRTFTAFVLFSCHLFTWQGTARGQKGSLSIIVEDSEPAIGHTLGQKSGDLLWFVAQGGKKTVIRKLDPDVYRVELLCAESFLRDDELTIHVEPRLDASAVFAREKPRHGINYFINDRTYILAYQLSPAPAYAAVENWRCGLEKALLPILLRKPGHVASAVEISEEVAKLSGGDHAYKLPAQTPLELYLPELSHLELDGRKARTDAFRDDRQRILSQESSNWPLAKGQFVGREPVYDNQARLYLGMLIAAANPSVLDQDQSGSIEVSYLSSHEDLSIPADTTYQLEVTGEQVSSVPDQEHLRISPERANPQEIAPQVNQGFWVFPVRALAGFNGANIRLKYRLLKKSNGSSFELRSGTFPKLVKFEAKAPQSGWDQFKETAKGIREWIAWVLAVALAVWKIVDLYKGGKTDDTEPELTGP